MPCNRRAGIGGDYPIWKMDLPRLTPQNAVMDADTADEVGLAELTVGSAGHRRALARFFLDTYIDYDPVRIHWPALDEAERSRLLGLPFWQEAVATESETSGKVMAAAQ